MRRVLLLVLVCALVAPAGARASDEDLTRWVDPMIGTLGAGFVFPGPATPYGMVQNSPDTEGYFAYTGYQYTDHTIRGYSLVHVESMGVTEGGYVPIMPTTGNIVTDVKQYQDPFSHTSEVATPGYYKVTPASGITTELTAADRVAMDRFTFPAGGSHNVLFDVGRMTADSNIDDVGQTTAGQNRAHVHILPAANEVEGTANLDRATGDNYAVHFVARFDQPFARYGTWSARGAAPVPGNTDVTNKGAGAFVSFESPDTVGVKIGVSFVSVANARVNLDAEPEDNFDALRARTHDAWNDALHSIEVAGGTDQEKTSFYSALYHAQNHPNIFNDANGDYLGYDNAVHNIADAPMNGHPYYANYSMWDTYRAEMPLLMLIAPDRVRDMVRSLAAIAQQGGRIPRWGLQNVYADFMNGEPGLQVVADAFCRGLAPNDAMSILYPNMRGLALDPNKIRDPSYLALGYVPYPGSGASSTLEDAIGDFSLALVADRLGNTADRDALLARAQSWKNIFDDADTKLIRPRFSDGSWFGNAYAPDPASSTYTPEAPDGWREGTGWQYTWLVPQDAKGLFQRMGNDSATQRLDQFFGPSLAAPIAGPEVQQKITAYGIAYAGNQYAPSNEHDLQAPWLYNWLGQPWKTQQLQRSLQSIYRATPDGLPGNDDLGTMSAWFVWSALGFYPTTPGSPTYTIGSPLFEHATIRLPSGSFTVDAPGASAANKFVQAARVNGSDLTTTSFGHSVLTTAGASLQVQLAASPSLTWGTGADAAPPSQTGSALADFACSG